jgi:hypothetical protein
MASPITSLATLRPDLASYFEYDLEADRSGYVAARVLPVMEVRSAAGNFGKVKLEDLLQKRDTLRTPGSNYNRGNFQFDDAVYATREQGAEEVVDDNEAQMYADYFDLEQVCTARAYSAVLRSAEQRVASAIFNTTTWTGSSLTTAITNEWDTNHTTNAVPINDVEAAVNKVYDASGLWPNALIINRKVFRNLRNLDQIIERIESAGAGNASKPSDITAEMLARVFDLDFVIIAGSSKNGADEGLTATPEQIWSSEYAMVCKIATGNDMREPCIGRTFHWSADGSSIGGTVESYREEGVRGNVIRVRHQVAEVVLHAEAGHLLSNVTTL